MFVIKNSGFSCRFYVVSAPLCNFFPSTYSRRLIAVWAVISTATLVSPLISVSESRPTLSSRTATPFSRWLASARRRNTTASSWRWLIGIIKLQIAEVTGDKQWKFTGDVTVKTLHVVRWIDRDSIRRARLTLDSRHVV